MIVDPIRLGFGAARFGVRVGLRLIELPLKLIPHGGDAATAAPSPPPPPTRPTPRPVQTPPPEAEAAPTATPRTAVATPAPPEPPRAPEPEPPAHIDDEPELVAEFAEEGAEDGAGAELHVDEPWDGYRRMRVADIQARVADADAATAGVVQLYEMTHRKRRSILDAVERRSKQLANSPNGR